MTPTRRIFLFFICSDLSHVLFTSSPPLSLSLSLSLLVSYYYYFCTNLFLALPLCPSLLVVFLHLLSFMCYTCAPITLYPLYHSIFFKVRSTSSIPPPPSPFSLPSALLSVILYHDFLPSFTILGLLTFLSFTRSFTIQSFSPDQPYFSLSLSLSLSLFYTYPPFHHLHRINRTSSVARGKVFPTTVCNCSDFSVQLLLLSDAMYPGLRGNLQCQYRKHVFIELSESIPSNILKHSL